LSHKRKQDLQRTSTEAGISIDVSDEHCKKAPSSICRSFAPGSNLTIESFSHKLKHNLERTSAEEGIEIDLSEEQFRKTESSIR
jgi:hypothetical protein